MHTNIYSMVKTAGMVMPYQAATGPSGSQPHELGGEYGLRNVERCGGYGAIATASFAGAAAGLAGLGPATRYVKALTPGKVAGSAVSTLGSLAYRNKEKLPLYKDEVKRTATDLATVYSGNTLDQLKDISVTKPLTHNLGAWNKALLTASEDTVNYIKNRIQL